MEWIKEGIDNWREAVRKSDLIAESAEGIFDDLWNEVVEISLAAKTQGMNLATNGAPSKRVVIMDPMHWGPKMVESRKLSIELAKNQRSIVAQSDAGEMVFEIAVCPDGVVCLKRGASKITAREAAKEIMQSFLFKGKSPFSAPASTAKD
jgi:hypothetical protein